MVNNSSYILDLPNSILINCCLRLRQNQCANKLSKTSTTISKFCLYNSNYKLFYQRKGKSRD